MLTVLAGREGTSLATLMFWRYALAAAALWPIAWRRDARASTQGAAPDAPRGLEAVRLIAVAGIGQAAVAGLSLSSLRWIPAATLGFLFYTFPAWVVLFAAVRGTERVDARRLLALALSLGGIALTIGDPSAGGEGGGGAGARSAWPGYALALSAALAYALYIPFLGRLQARTNPARASAFVTLGAAVCFALLGVVDGTLTVRLPGASWGYAALLALVCTVIAFLVFMRGLGGLGPVRTAIVSTVEPFWTALLGALVLAQPLSAGTLAGGALIAAAVLLIQLPSRRSPSSAAPERG